MAGVKASIADMRPTQLTLGLSEVEERAAKIAAMTPADREAHLERKPVPHVLGPGKKIYIVDHHHLARALWSLKIPEAVLGERVADWSGLEPKAFWRMMESERLLLADRRRRQSQTLRRHSRFDRRPHRQRLAHAGATRARQGVRGSGHAVSGIHVGRLFSHIHDPAADRVGIRTRRRAGDEACAPVRGAGPARLSRLTRGSAKPAPMKQGAMRHAVRPARLSECPAARPDRALRGVRVLAASAGAAGRENPRSGDFVDRARPQARRVVRQLSPARCPLRARRGRGERADG